ncbi:hypothetical protein [Streptomyces peucetius]|uniref:Uncharacterized protein n=1 Tax=Streptomyces peucetius TaxID=1950 RepID=A0ABY6ICI2_STRPE|nr:hypothetical protein [Streptomyces peucetius]UYQ64709.1 hypothetical protein OGH68_26810 [Streptomyces peucetius]
MNAHEHSHEHDHDHEREHDHGRGRGCDRENADDRRSEGAHGAPPADTAHVFRAAAAGRTDVVGASGLANRLRPRRPNRQRHRRHPATAASVQRAAAEDEEEQPADVQGSFVQRRQRPARRRRRPRPPERSVLPYRVRLPYEPGPGQAWVITGPGAVSASADGGLHRAAEEERHRVLRPPVMNTGGHDRAFMTATGR